MYVCVLLLYMYREAVLYLNLNNSYKFKCVYTINKHVLQDVPKVPVHGTGQSTHKDNRDQVSISILEQYVIANSNLSFMINLLEYSGKLS